MTDRVLISASIKNPPSSNHIYANGPHGGRVLTRLARQWKILAIKELTGQMSIEDSFDPDQAYAVTLIFYLKNVENEGWYRRYKRGPKAGQRYAQRRWKKIDLSNLVKLAEDSLKEAMGVDDCAFFELRLVKDQALVEPSMTIEVRAYDVE